ncbi:helix-turn-helix domain-containing protein [Paraburkholderia denitrificans]|uniref:Helix-turn-helix domain-containing protein n=1 Tax=Paraburkholderia denitrificans TaxID=694025 RepID=A0ABW0J938_9BURK
MTANSPAQFFIQKGATISSNGRDYIITAIADINLVFARDIESKAKVLLKIGDIGPPRLVHKPLTDESVERDLLGVPADQWAIAEERRQLIAPLLDSYYHRSNALAYQLAARAGVSKTTIYRWLAEFRNSGLLSSLLPNASERGGRGKARISAEVETVIRDCIENFHDTMQNRTIAETITEIRRRCTNAGLPPPAINTIRIRLQRTDGHERVGKRNGPAAAHDQFAPIISSIPDANWPLAMVQVDHTLLPVIIVDDIHRKSIRRAWITLAIDVFSRVCLGMHLSLDAPSAMSAGMCISHAILPKEQWLNRIGTTVAEWPFWGTMGILHMDNAREFRGNMLNRACQEYDIDLHLRPVKKPRYGAHIERLMGTVSQGLKGLKGATFSGPDEKGKYDAEGNACMTFSELEKWLILFFARYHRKRHSGIRMPPLDKWREGLLGNGTQPGRGLPVRRTDGEQLRINFMPFEERTVQNYGVVIDDVHYYHDVLRPYINAPHPEFPRHRRKFRFHRDPRDISVLYFYDEISRRYCAIPYRDTSLPPASIWELRDARQQASERGISQENEKAVFALLNEQRRLEEDAAAKTKSARRAQQRRTQHAIARQHKTEDLPSVSQIESSPPLAVRGYDPDAVVPMEDD